MWRRFFIVDRHSDTIGLRELAPEIGFSIQQYGSVSSGEVMCEEQCWTFLFMQDPEQDADAVAATLCEAVLTGKQPVEMKDQTTTLSSQR